MPLFILLILVEIVFVIHAVKTGRASPWAFIILFAPVVGVVAYIVAVMIPDMMGSRQGQQTQRRIAKAFNPEKRYHELADALAVADTIANRAALAEECIEIGRYHEAQRHFEEILTRRMGDEPVYMAGKARAQFGLEEFANVIATLDELRQRWPDYQSADAHMLYARALEGAGRLEDALTEYRALSDYFIGAEARVRYGLVLVRLGRDGEAKAWLNEVLTQLRRAPDHVRKAQAEWITAAEKVVRA